MEGFNNFEQGLLIACAIASTGSIFWLALVMSSASLRTIDIAHHLKRTAEATADAQLEMVRIANLLENPPITIEESAESVAQRKAEEAAKAAPVLQAFGNMTPEERAAKRRARRIFLCNEHIESADQLLRNAFEHNEDEVVCPNCTAVALVHRPTDGRAPFLGEWK